MHKQCVLIEAEGGYVEVVSYYDTKADHYGADIFYLNHYTDTITLMKSEPQYEQLLTLGYNFLKGIK